MNKDTTKEISGTSTKPYEVVSFSTDKGKRFMVITSDGEILDDARGYGYKTVKSAHKGYWYNTKGKEVIDKHKEELKTWKTNNPKAVKEIDSWFGSMVKEIAIGDYSTDWVFNRVEKTLSIEIPKNIRKNYNKY